MRNVLYVAGASAEIERAERFIAAARQLGYVVTHDWTAMVRSVGRANGAIGDDARRGAKRFAYDGASTCGVFVFLLPGIRSIDGADMAFEPVHTIGAWWELGIAVERDHGDSTCCESVNWHVPRAFLIVGDNPERTVMTVDLDHAETDALALDWLRGRLQSSSSADVSRDGGA